VVVRTGGACCRVVMVLRLPNTRLVLDERPPLGRAASLLARCPPPPSPSSPALEWGLPPGVFYTVESQRNGRA
jgi:hypothetical protein